MDLGIAGKWALVGGASKGLGHGCARALALEGVHVVMVARTEAALTQAALALAADPALPPGTRVLSVPADITTEAGREAAFQVAGGPGFAFDIVVTNAGGPPPGDFRQWDRATWLRAIDANMLTPIELIKATVDGMAERGFGRVINITSSAVKAPIDSLGLSNGARSGLTGFIAGLARSSLAARGVTMNSLLPGPFDTDRLRANTQGAAQRLGQDFDVLWQQRQQAVPAKRFGTPAEFGAACAFLCSRHAGYINGQNILLDGGAFAGTF